MNKDYQTRLIEKLGYIQLKKGAYKLEIDHLRYCIKYKDYGLLDYQIYPRSQNFEGLHIKYGLKVIDELSPNKKNNDITLEEHFEGIAKATFLDSIKGGFDKFLPSFVSSKFSFKKFKNFIENESNFLDKELVIFLCEYLLKQYIKINSPGFMEKYCYETYKEGSYYNIDEKTKMELMKDWYSYFIAFLKEYRIYRDNIITLEKLDNCQMPFVIQKKYGILSENNITDIINYIEKKQPETAFVTTHKDWINSKEGGINFIGKSKDLAMILAFHKQLFRNRLNWRIVSNLDLFKRLKETDCIKYKGENLKVNSLKTASVGKIDETDLPEYHNDFVNDLINLIEIKKNKR